MTTTSGAHRGVGYSVASFPGPPSSGALPTPQGNSLSVPSTVMICGCVMCVNCYRRSGNFRVIKFSCFKFSRKNIFVD